MYQNSFQIDKAILLSDNDYYRFLSDKIDRAQKYVYAAIFIINIHQDREGMVRNLLEKLTYAQWRGIDVRLIIGHSQKNDLIDLYDRMTYEFVKTKIPVKYANPDDDYSLHSKYVVIDDEMSIAGSHNWEEDAFVLNKEDSLVTYSRDLALELKYEFEKLWATGLEE